MSDEDGCAHAYICRKCGDGRFEDTADAVAWLKEPEPRGQEDGAWRPIETAPKDGTPVRLYAAALVHEDFNPSGSVEGYWQDDEGWVGALWDGCQDCWNATTIRPSHWQPLPAPPEAI